MSASAVIQNFECYDEDLDGNELPKLANAIDVWNLIEPSYISVPAYSFLQYYDVKILEHGLEVRFRNGYADESDRQGYLRVDN